MDQQTAFHWQWLLRNTAAGLNSAPGKSWLKEARKRLAPIGERQFLSRIDDWFTFPQEEIHLSPAGSAVLRLLIWYGAVADAERSLPILVRLAHLSWRKRAPVGKVMAALAWMLRCHDGSKFPAEVQLVCEKWAEHSAEARRLEKAYFPERAHRRDLANEDARERRYREHSARMEAMLSSLRERYPHIFGPGGRAARLMAAHEAAKSSRT